MSPWLYLLQQSFSAASLLFTLGLCLGLRRLHPLRLAATSLLCGLASLLGAAGAGLMRITALALVTLLAPVAALHGLPRARRISAALCSLGLTLVMAGCGRLMHSFGLARTPLILGQAAALPAVVRLMPSTAGGSCITLEITHGRRRIALTALVDSGNLLRDPLTRLPVIVISRKAAAQLIPGLQEFSPGMRLISVRTVASTALMPIFRPDGVRLCLPQGWHTAQAVIGLSPDGYSGFQALVPQSLTTNTQGGMPLCP